MKKIKDLMGIENEILFELNENNSVAFLTYAKNNSCVWFNGFEIKPQEDSCSFHIVVSKDLTIANLSTQCLVNSKKSYKTYQFEV